MEDEIKSLRSVLSHVLNSGTRPNAAYPNNSPSFNERDFSHSSARTSERHARRYIDNPLPTNENDILSPLLHESRSSDKMQFVPGYLENSHLNGHMNGAYCPPENEANDSDIMQMEKETLKLRQELQDMKDSTQKADSKIQECVATSDYRLFVHPKIHFLFCFTVSSTPSSLCKIRCPIRLQRLSTIARRLQLTANQAKTDRNHKVNCKLCHIFKRSHRKCCQPARLPLQDR